MNTKSWRDHVSPEFRVRAEAALRKSRGNLMSVQRNCRNRWIDLRCIESGVNLRGRTS